MPEKIAFPYIEFLIILLTVLRYNVGFDWPAYYHLVFPEINQNEFKKIERIPQLIFRFSHYLNSPILMYTLLELPMFCFFFVGFKELSDSRYESLIIFMTCFYLESLSTMRQWLALSIVFYSYKYLKNHYFFKYLFFSIIAFFCHKSSLVGTFGIFVIFNFKNEKFFVFMSILCIVLGRSFIDILGNTNLPYSYYLRYLKNYNGGNMTRLFFLGLTLVCYFLTLKNQDRETKRLRMLCLFGNIFPFILGGHIGSRIGVYFYFFLVLLVPKALLNLKGKYIHQLAMCIFYLFFIFCLYVNSKNSAVYIPYRFYPLVNIEIEGVKPR